MYFFFRYSDPTPSLSSPAHIPALLIKLTTTIYFISLHDLEQYFPYESIKLIKKYQKTFLFVSFFFKYIHIFFPLRFFSSNVILIYLTGLHMNYYNLQDYYYTFQEKKGNGLKWWQDIEIYIRMNDIKHTLFLPITSQFLL
jgi:hypothetical protein